MPQSVTTPDTLEGRNMRADVYYNLRVGGLSVVDRRPGSDTYGNVVSHSEQAWITGAKVVTYEGKREKAVAEDRKNVHAMFRGNVATRGDLEPSNSVDPVKIHYHADKEGCFYDQRGRRLLEAEAVIIHGQQIRALHPTFE